MVAVFVPCELIFPLEQLTARALLLWSRSQQTRSNAVTNHTTRQRAITGQPARVLCVRFKEITIVPGMVGAQRTAERLQQKLFAAERRVLPL